MSFAEIVVGSLWVVAIIFIIAGVLDLHKAEQHRQATEKIMRELGEGPDES